METTVREILDELYKVDADLKDKEDQILPIIERMLKVKPKSTFDERFKAELHSRILAEIRKMKSEKVKRSYFWQNLSFALGGIAFASFFIFAVLPNLAPNILPGSNNVVPQYTTGATDVNTPSLTFQASIEETGGKAFGKLNLGSAAGRGGGGGGAGAAMAPEAMNDASVSSKIAPGIAPYVPTYYKYVYKGESFGMSGTQMNVYKKEKGTFNSSDLGAFIQKMNIDAFDISKLQSMKLNQFTVSEDKEYGLQMSISLDEGTISLWKNYLKWPQTICRDEACFAQSRAKIEQLPSDQDAIAIANDFAKNYGIDVSNFGSPFVNKEWKREYDRMADKAQAYVPEVVSVVYPARIEGKNVYEEYGGSKGLTLNIDVKTRKVSDVYGIEKSKYLASLYDIDTNTGNIVTIAEKGGRTGWMYPMDMQANDPQGTKIIEVSLGTPSLEYIHMYDYKDGASVEYFVPAYVFPVTTEPKEGEWFANRIVVPVVKDFYLYDGSAVKWVATPAVR